MSETRQLHIRYEGRSMDLSLDQLDIGDISTDGQVKEAVANFLNVPVTKFNAFAVDRNQENGSLTLRPEAVFG